MSMTVQSGLCPNQIDYINAHATSTPIGKKIATLCWFCLVLQKLNLYFCYQFQFLGDAVEARAIKTVFSEHATSGTLAFSSTKVKMPHVS